MLPAVALLVLALAAPPPDTVGAPPPPAATAPGAAAPAATVPTDPLSRLTAALARFPATTPVRARLDHRVRFTQGDDDPAPWGSVVASAASGPDGMRLGWSPAVLAQAETEERARRQNPEAPTPTRDAIGDLRPLTVARALDAVPDLLRELGDAKVLADRMEPLDGTPTRMLELHVAPSVASRDRKYVKDIEATTRVWLGADGVPVAVDRRVLLKGRIFLFIGFEIEQREVLRLGRSGDRLVVLRQEADQRSEGASERRDRHAVTVLSVLD